jgi:LPS-assembly protein
LGQKLTINSSFFYEKNYPWGKSPLPDDRDDQDRLLKPALSLNIDRELPQSSISLKSSAEYDLDLEDWEEINLRVQQNEDCYSFYINYEFIDETVSFGFEI